MTYRVEVQYSPVYELLVSLRTYTDRTTLKLSDMNAAWAKRVRQQLPPNFDQTVAALEGAEGGPPFTMVEQFPRGADPRAALDWIAGLAPGELYERLAPLAGDQKKVPPNLAELRDLWVGVLRTWNDCYFAKLDPAINAGLAADAAAKQALVTAMAPEELVEHATGGMIIDPIPGMERVLLVPQYHSRPTNLVEWAPGVCMVLYAVEALPAAPGAVPAPLRALTHALADESRLLILRYLAGGVRTFTDVVKQSGLAKSTVHHHLVALRASGLVRVHSRPDEPSRYSLRPDAVSGLGDRLNAFLKGE